MRSQVCQKRTVFRFSQLRSGFCGTWKCQVYRVGESLRVSVEEIIPMAQSQPVQPNQPQYPISTLFLFPNYASRAAYQQATGHQAPPFDPSRPPQYWEDPSQAGKSGIATYSIVDETAAGSGYVSVLNVNTAWAASVNLPGVFNYPQYVSAPTDAMMWGPFGPVGQAPPDQVCLQSDAQAMANTIAAFFPGQTPAVLEENNGAYHYVYGNDPRRQWYIQIGKNNWLAQTLIESQNSHGIGYPGKWSLVGGVLNWTPGNPVTEPPSGTPALPLPIRALLPNEQIVHLPGSLFTPAGTWVVERTDLQQPQPAETEDQQFADLKAMLAQIQATLNTIASKQ